MIRIAKLGGAYMVQASPPEVKKAWRPLLPMSARGVIEELVRHGCGLHQAMAALIEADPRGARAVF